MEKTLGGDRLGSGKKMKVHLHGYERSTHDRSKLWRSTMSAGTLVPFMKELCLPGDTLDINLNCEIQTHPTEGPLFGSFKVQLDVFLCPLRLYIGKLHNNHLGIGMKMSEIKFPLFSLHAKVIPTTVTDLDNAQINPSCILNYLGLRGVGIPATGNDMRSFNAIPFLAYWEIYKNYYSNKQEEIGAVIHTTVSYAQTLNDVTVSPFNSTTETSIPMFPNTGNIAVAAGSLFHVKYTGQTVAPENIIFEMGDGTEKSLRELSTTYQPLDTGLETQWNYDITLPGNTILRWKYRTPNSVAEIEPKVATFPLDNIDAMRELILNWSINTAPFDVNSVQLTPYKWVLEDTNTFANCLNSQEGLALKTYQSDLFNNWLSTDWIDGVNGITELTKIDTTSGGFTLDTLNLSKKIYDMLNRIAVSGGSYRDWLEVTYDHFTHRDAESPMYMGGLIKELVFQEVISNASANTGEGNAPLGTLAGRGVMAKKHKGGYVHINVDEPAYVIGIVSLTPRIDYSQGNDWDITQLKTMDDLHKPALDQIGFQELITEQFAWWDTHFTVADGWIQKSAGKQPAWINYMTNVNKVYGNFAIEDNEMFMTLNRRYENQVVGGTHWTIKDLTTYIDPVKFNHIFTIESIDAQNFWTQISVDLTHRRKMSAKIMPNL